MLTTASKVLCALSKLVLGYLGFIERATISILVAFIIKSYKGEFRLVNTPKHSGRGCGLRAAVGTRHGKYCLTMT